MRILISIVIFLALAFFSCVAETSFAKRRNGTYEGLKLGLLIAGGFSLAIALSNFFIMRAKGTPHPSIWEYRCGIWGLIALIMMPLISWRFFLKRANRWVKEFACYALVVLGAFLVSASGLAAFSTIYNGFWGRSLNWWPIVTFIGTIVGMLFTMIENTEHEAFFRKLILFVAIALIVIFAIIMWPDYSKKTTSTKTTTAAANQTTTAQVESNKSEEDEFGIADYVTEADLKKLEEEQPEEKTIGFYNLALLKDDIEDNDFNFGWNPYKENAEANYYREDFYVRLNNDPAFCAAAMAWVDYHCHTRFIGKFYDECDGAWDAAINAARDGFIADEDHWIEARRAFHLFLETAEVELRYANGGITDQMYMNPYTENGYPDVIVLKTNNHSGHFLVFKFKIKEETIDVGYRIECGYQPTDVEKTLKITPQKKPEKPNKPTTPPPTTDKKKDPTKGTQGEVTKPNDNPGPGPDTNNGEGAQTSKAEETPNSTQMTNKEYDEHIEEVKVINETQKEGGDSNTPSTSTPAPDKDQGQKTTNVENNADKGTGNGGIDKPTDVKPVALDKDNKPINEGEKNPSGKLGTVPD